MGGKVRAAALIAISLIAAIGFAGSPHAARATSSVALGTRSFGRILVDPASLQVFVSSPGDNSIVVLDLNGNIIKTITGESGANAMVVVGSTLYVSLQNTGDIDRIDTGTLTETSPLVSGLTQPGDLAYAGGRLWTTTGACSGSTMKPASIDLSAVTPTATTYDGIFDNTNKLSYCARFASDHATNPTYILLFSSGLDPVTFNYMDVSGSTPSITKTAAGGSNPSDVTVTADEVHFIGTAVDYCPNTNTYCFREYKLSDLSFDGLTYPAQRFPIGADTTSSNGAKFVGGISAANSVADTNLAAYPIGDPSQVIASASFGQYETTRRGIAISPNGLTAYAVGQSPNCSYGPCEELNLVDMPALPANGAPSPPTNVTAGAGVGAAMVSWHPPTYHGTSPITGYTVYSSGGTTATVGADQLGALLAGLASTPHTFTVVATNLQGSSVPSAPSNSVTPLAGGTYNPLNPSRMLDTRSGYGGFHRVGAWSTISLQVAGRKGVPATGWSAAALNVTVTNTLAAGFLTVYPSGSPRPTASSLNFARGSTVPNLVQVAIGPNGKVNIFVAGAAADLIVDVEGWYGDSTDSYGPTGLYYPMPPQRQYDSRFISTANGNLHQPLGPGETRAVYMFGSTIGSWSEAVVLNVTVTAPTRVGFLTVFPTGTSRPVASNLNFVPGQTVANRVIVPVGIDGNVSFYNPAGNVDIVIDVSGFFTGFGATSDGAPFITGNPVRLFDSRAHAGGKLGPGYFYDFTLGGPQLEGLALNVTATNPTSYGFLTVYPDNGTHGQFPPPSTSDLNFGPGQTVANACLVRTQDAMSFNVYNAYGSTDIIIDVDGVYGTLTGGFNGAASTAKNLKEPQRAANLPVRGSSSPRMATTPS
ncbi:MAG: fibronectin type III domain-containing protein [Chloroflexi bacterium]|nr:MAG: fibronectin type III domain-containing protein [Chloroflexota bacterium]